LVQIAKKDRIMSRQLQKKIDAGAELSKKSPHWLLKI